MTIVDIAKAAGVSTATVSRVINGNPKISAATATLVKKTMQELGYTPLPPKRRRGPKLKTQNREQTGNVAVLTFGPTSRVRATHYALNMQNISSALAEHGLNMIYAHIVQENSLPSCIINGHKEVDGYIILQGDPSAETLSKLECLPVVFMSSRRDREGDHVISGHNLIGQMAAEYLIGLGCKNLTFLDAIPQHPANRAQAEGFRFAAFQNNHANIKSFLGKTSKSTPDNMAELDSIVEPLVDKLCNSTPLPDGIFIPQDRTTAAVYRYLYRRGIKPQQQIKIISSGNEEPYLIGLDPRPVTIDMGHDAMGKNAVNLLMLRMRSPKAQSPMQITVKPTLIEFPDY